MGPRPKPQDIKMCFLILLPAQLFSSSGYKALSYEKPWSKVMEFEQNA